MTDFALKRQSGSAAALSYIFNISCSVPTVKKGRDIISENNGRKKMGRPTDDPKNLMIKFRVSTEDIEKLEFCAEKTKQTKSEIIRQGINEVYTKIKK